MTHAKPDEEQPQTTQPEPHGTPAAPAPRVPSRLATAVPVLISLVAVGLAGWALVRPTAKTPPAPPTPTAQQVADAQGTACAAYARVRTAVALQSQADVGSDPNAARLAAVNARLAMAVGSQHIVDNLSPAVPAELSDLLRSVATGLQGLAVNALAGASGDEPGQVARLRELETTSQKIADLCT